MTSDILLLLKNRAISYIVNLDYSSMMTVSQQTKEITVGQQDKVDACDQARRWRVLTASAQGWVAVNTTLRNGAPLVSRNG